ncbi:hypothetical protein BGW39_001952 [Mortierella sp. 14UC]|nr:hypothetical protein BGW39_001952 [Mortierella sp. 14UC]
MPEIALDHPHICGHEGYELKRLDQLSRQYGSYALNILESTKYGLPLRDQKAIRGDIAAGIDEAIEFLRPGRTSSREAFDRRVEAGASRTMAAVNFSGVRRFLKDVDVAESIHPDGSGGLGCLTKGTTPTGQTTWLCRTHHQAIYDTNALMKLTTFKAPYAASLARLFRALISTSLATELDLLMDLDMTYKGLKLLKDAIFGMKRLRRLRLDFGNHGGPTTDDLNRGKRGDVLAEILTSSNGSSQGQNTFAAFDRINLAERHLEANFEPKAHSQKLRILFHRCSKLEVLELWCSDAHFCDIVDLVKGVFQGQATFGFLHLNSRHFKATFDRVYFDAQVDSLSRCKSTVRYSQLSETKVLQRFRPLIHTFAIDDTTTNKEIAVLRDIVEQQQGSKLRRIDLVVPSPYSHVISTEHLLSVVHTLNNTAAIRSLKDTNPSEN